MGHVFRGQSWESSRQPVVIPAKLSSRPLKNCMSSKPDYDDGRGLGKGTLFGFLAVVGAIVIFQILLQQETEKGSGGSAVVLVPLGGLALLVSSIFCLLRMWRAQRLGRKAVAFANFICLLICLALVYFAFIGTADMLDAANGRPSKYQRDLADSQEKKAQRIAEIDGILAVARTSMVQIEAAMGTDPKSAWKFCDEIQTRRRKTPGSVSEAEAAECTRLSKLYGDWQKLMTSTNQLFQERDRLDPSGRR